MAFPFIQSGGGRRRILFIGVALLLVIGMAAYAFVHLGRFMAPEDPLEKADAIFVLAGTLAERPLEAADLYHAGYAPRVLVTRSVAEQGVLIAMRRGIKVPSEFEVSKEVLLQLGVPQDALVAPDHIHDNTADEARTLRQLAQQYGWHRVIVVSSKYHLRRAGFAVERALAGTDVDIRLRGSRYDRSTPDRWWQRRADIRWLLAEVPKYAAYRLGLGSS